MVLAAADDTWGVSGPVFLLAYAVLAIAVWAATTAARRSLADPPGQPPAGGLDARPYDAAVLNGGPELAVYAALSALRQRGAISSARGEVSATGRLDHDADPFERAVHAAAAAPVHRRRLLHHRAVVAEVAAAEKRLVRDGLLLSGAQRARIRRVGWWTVAVAGVGLLRLLAGISEARPVGLLVVALAVVSVVAAVQLARAPRRSRRGDAALESLRTRHHALSPESAPDWVLYGPVAAALAVGVFGTGALWASDPAFAEELALQRAAAGGGGDTGGGSDGGGSDGGGGGCGGGCGGCGG